LEGARHETAEGPQEEKEDEVSLLLDTHYVYGLSGSPGTISAREAAFLKAYTAPFVVSAVSIWEIRIKWSTFDGSGKRKGPADPKGVLRVLTTDFVDFLLLTPAHAALELKVPIAHRDPFDELLLAQAQSEGLKLLSRDRKLVGHPLVTEID
jgi:PIN domain nuclease of toxin-antitoxin system